MSPYRINARPACAPLSPRARCRTHVAGPLGRVFVCAIALFVNAQILSGCAFLQKHAKDALDVAQIACIIAHQFQPDPAVQQLCQIEDELYEPMRRILAESRAAADHVAAETAESVRAGTCGRDRTP